MAFGKRERLGVWKRKKVGFGKRRNVEADGEGLCGQRGPEGGGC